MKREIDVLATGHICFDIIPQFPPGKKILLYDLLAPGKLINIGTMTTSTGGSVSNTGLATHILGAKTVLLSKVGDDFIGDAILSFLKGKISTNGIKRAAGESSSYTIVLAPPGVDRIFLHHPGTNDTFGYDDIDFALVKNAKIFHFGYPPVLKKMYANGGRKLTRIFKRAKELGTTTSLDFSLPDPDSPSGKVKWRKILQNVLPYVDIFLPSVEEALFMLDREKFIQLRKKAKAKELVDFFDGSDLTQIAQIFLSYGAKIVGLKCGRRGFYVRTASRENLQKLGYAKPANLDNWSNRELWEPTYRVKKLVSTTGSGDSTIAGFLVAYLKGESIEMSMKYGCMCGAQNVQVVDATSGIKSWRQTTKEIKMGIKKNSLTIKTPQWKYDARQELWHGAKDKEQV